MKHNYTLAIFDLDGTILNTLDDLAASVNSALAACALPSRTADEVRSFVGNGIRRLIERSVPEGTDKSVTDDVFARFKEHYALHCADRTAPYSGIIAVLETLRAEGVMTAVVSNKADFAVQELCSRYFEGLFDAAVGEREGIKIKPAPDSVNEVLSRLGILPENAVYIGDSDVDIQTAQNAHMDCISVSWGFRSEDFLRENGAEIIAERPEQLTAMIIGE